MAWYEEAVFYHIYPLGLSGAPKQNAYEEPVHRLKDMLPWIDHIRSIGCNAIYIGPLFESVGHGYETTDYRKLDSRLGTNEDLKEFVKTAHEAGIRVIFDGVFNHTGRDFFAFKDIRENRENSRYRDWYCNVNFYGNNEYNDGFSYDNWGGYNLLARLNQWNGEVRQFIHDVIVYWVQEFDVDGIRLDTADVLDFDFMKMLRRTANEVKPDFYLMGEVIHGEYNRWVNPEMLHAVTNYSLHKALYSGHNEHNYFEIAHTVRRLYGMGGNRTAGLRLYNFVDNHDVERIYTKLYNKAHLIPVHILLYTLPGVPSIYYGSEFGIEGRKDRGGSDDAIRPALNLKDYEQAEKTNVLTGLISVLGRVRQNSRALAYGEYEELLLTNRQYAFARDLNGERVLVLVNNDDGDYSCTLRAGSAPAYIGALSGRRYEVHNGCIEVSVSGNSGEIFLPETDGTQETVRPFEEPDVSVSTWHEEKAESAAAVQEEPAVSEQKEERLPEMTAAGNKQEQVQQPEEKPSMDELLAASRGMAYEEMTVEMLQAVILEKMSKNGPVTEQMRRDVENNIWQNSLVNWAKSFR